MGLLVDASLPVDHSSFTSDQAIPKVLFLAAHSLSPRVGLTYNLGPSLATVSSSTSALRPDAERDAQVDELASVIAVVIEKDQCRPK